MQAYGMALYQHGCLEIFANGRKTIATSLTPQNGSVPEELRHAKGKLLASAHCYTL